MSVPLEDVQLLAQAASTPRPSSRIRSRLRTSPAAKSSTLICNSQANHQTVAAAPITFPATMRQMLNDIKNTKLHLQFGASHHAMNPECDAVTAVALQVHHYKRVHAMEKVIDAIKAKSQPAGEQKADEREGEIISLTLQCPHLGFPHLVSLFLNVRSAANCAT